MRNLPFSVKNDAGLTLVEVMISLVVLLVAALGVAAAFPVGLVASRQGEDITRAAHLAQEKIEQLRAVGYGTLRGQLQDFGGASYPNQSITIGDGQAFTRSTRIACWTWSSGQNRYVEAAAPFTTPCTSLLAVRVRVTWTFRGVTRNTELETFVADRS